MRRDEAFVAQAVAKFLGGPSFATASDGDDPPDVYLTLRESRVGLEVKNSIFITGGTAAFSVHARARWNAGQPSDPGLLRASPTRRPEYHDRPVTS